MSKVIPGIVILVLGIGMLLGVVMWVKKIDLPLNEDDCEKPDKYKTPCGGDTTCCGVWDKTQCRKGKKDGDGDCVSKGNVGPLILGIAGVIFVLAGIIKLIFAILR